jgi:hypothetical protein
VCLDVREEYRLCPKLALSEDSARARHGDLPHQGKGKNLIHLGEIPAAPLRGRSDTLDIDVVAKATSWQETSEHAFLLENVKVFLLLRLQGIVVGLL